ncbi:MAG TPA: CxxxxCH/CxxCH domain-containing protein [Myxococcaceae bacterium]|nr:CxxxxCH/CxxCH domain-containing protein [Myxococcaceae bacterium]
MSALLSRGHEHRATGRERTVRPAPASALIAGLALALTGCGVARDPLFGRARCPDFDAEIAPVLSRQCGDCHGGSTPAGGYPVVDRLSTLSRRDDGSARLVPGDPNSDFLAAARGDRAGHTAVSSDDQSLLEDWAVRCRAAPRTLAVHPPGWTTPTDAEQFHGAALRQGAYDLAPCRECHGEDLGGGAAKVACASCHPQGPLACNTCHGDALSFAPPKSLSGVRLTTFIGVGAHRSHTSDCSSCHVLPLAPEQEGHYRRGGALDLGPAEVFLPSAPGLTARWDRDTATCSGVACHAPAGAADARATHQSPQWTRVGAGEAACGSCHGLPPEDHGGAGADCARCHGAAYAGGQLLASKHANGVLDLGDGLGSGCSACHGDATSPAPPRDTAGRTSEALAPVGAHRAHLEARHHLRGPIACAECHRVPSSPLAPGHIDSALPAEVFPDASVGMLARADGASPTYDPATASCGSVYCHGAGTRASGDQAATRIPNPSWTGGTSQAICGACHGIPPADGLHSPTLTITGCARCHAPSIDPSGAIRITVDPVTGAISSTHMDGQPTFGAPTP